MNQKKKSHLACKKAPHQKIPVTVSVKESVKLL